MVKHIFLPGADLKGVRLLPEHEAWLREWLESIEADVEACNTASSICLQAAIAELVVYGETRHDWTEVLNTCLIDKTGQPLAYSKAFGERLFSFESQWRQSPVHAVHAHFWIRRLSDDDFDPQPFSELLQGFIQGNGWIYNPQVSVTQMRTRMKSEYTMSLAMSLEVFEQCGDLASRKDDFAATLADMPLTPYLSSEYFRARALELLGATEQAPVGIGEMVVGRQIGEGFCDFLVSEKVDDYMGTAKRVGRDVGVHSPLASLQARHLSRYSEAGAQRQIEARMDGFRSFLTEHPLEIPAFKIRDLAIPFGTDVSALEVIAASVIALS